MPHLANLSVFHDEYPGKCNSLKLNANVDDRQLVSGKPSALFAYTYTAAPQSVFRRPSKLTLYRLCEKGFSRIIYNLFLYVLTRGSSTQSISMALRIVLNVASLWSVVTAFSIPRNGAQQPLLLQERPPQPQSHAASVILGFTHHSNNPEHHFEIPLRARIASGTCSESSRLQENTDDLSRR